jgi:hypothetical protein
MQANFTAPSTSPAANQQAPQAATKTSRSDWQKAAESVARNFSTEEFATQLKVQPQTIRAGYCRDGHYLNLRPIKLLNRRLLWPAAEVDALAAGRTVKTPDASDLDEHFKRKTSDASKRPAHIVRKAEAAKAKRLTTGEVAK